jgi:hypothetical protein
MSNVTEHFIGIDPFIEHESAIEMQKDGKLFLSVYHECKLQKLTYQGKTLVLELKKVVDGYNNPSSPKLGDEIQLRFENASITGMHGEDEGNFEDINDLTLNSVRSTSPYLLLSITVAAINFTLECDKVALETVSK